MEDACTISEPLNITTHAQGKSVHKGTKAEISEDKRSN